MAEPSEERIGDYRVHPVASLFPALPDDEFDELKGSIELMGQTYPIVVQGDLLLDGRNRLRACIELGVPPKIQEYRGSQTPEFFIETVNMNRRHLDEEARAMISAQIRAWRIAQQNAEAQKTGKSADGTGGGRGHKKAMPMPTDQSAAENLTTDSSSGLTEPKTRARDARSTVGQIAEAAKVSHHKAAQAVRVVNDAPELADAVIAGKLPLREAEKKAAKRNPKKPKRKSRFNLDTAVGRAKQTMGKWIAKAPADSREDFKAKLLKECRELCRT